MPPRSTFCPSQRQTAATPRRSARAAFTLIELLVVISIIALLIGILLPALGAARETARGTVCQSNMRNLTLSFVSYSVDNKMWLPGRAFVQQNPTNANPHRAWTAPGGLQNNPPADLSLGVLWGYLGGSSASANPPRVYAGFSPTLSQSSVDYGYEAGVGTAAVFLCPSDSFAVERSSGLSYSGSRFIWDNEQPLDPGVSAQVGPAGPPVRGVAQAAPFNAFSNYDVFRAPSELILLVDEGGPNDDLAYGATLLNRGVNDGLFSRMGVPGVQGANQSIVAADKSKWYHGGSAAFGFLDGHGELRQKTDLEVVGFNVNLTYPRRSFGGYGRLWDPLAQAPLNPLEAP